MALDNLFTSWKTAKALKDLGIAVTGTVRKNAAGYPPRLLMLKVLNRALEWGHLEATVIHEVACWLWQDSNAVIGMTTGIPLTELVERERKRPRKTASNSKITR
ncbi:hypothetical protein GJ744_010187 [Endocarpon pusillum]|uniref:PiggyBac transposable element-derived protein domain-containing protein n=1 Tax=Endocarpon pusillum TaxID=364733 RepID=A0A8H7A4H3_9EURO|nr:hypothetical protein GJ744_010187 [Endocarpon pusillum]